MGRPSRVCGGNGLLDQFAAGREIGPGPGRGVPTGLAPAPFAAPGASVPGYHISPLAGLR